MPHIFGKPKYRRRRIRTNRPNRPNRPNRLPTKKNFFNIFKSRTIIYPINSNIQ